MLEYSFNVDIISYKYLEVYFIIKHNVCSFLANEFCKKVKKSKFIFLSSSCLLILGIRRKRENVGA